MPRTHKALDNLLSWTGNSEIDLYPYIREVFADIFGYPKDHIRLTERGSHGKIPDLSLSSFDVKPKEGIYWVVGEIKKERKAFRSAKYRRKEWEQQLKGYVSADTIYALLLDPETLVVLRPDGTEVKIVELDVTSADDLLSSTAESSLAFLHYKNSICENSLQSFEEGMSPSKYLDVTRKDDRKKFYDALRVSARELIDFSTARLQKLQKQYREYQAELASLQEKVGTVQDDLFKLTTDSLEKRYREAYDFFEKKLKAFETQIGRQIPKKEEEARRFLQNLYATEGSSLVLARVLFVRFLEDNEMTIRKISNGGLKAFRDYHRYIKDDYQFLLTDAYKDAEHLYHRLFEPSIFDWSHKGNGEFSRLLLRIFYRLNAFDFSKISGDILGNLYERFLDIEKRKKLGEYYTPMYVARYVLQRIGFYDNPGPLLDPACGSGTFLIAAMVGLLNRLSAKNVKLDLAIRQAVNIIHGLDINVFAAFTAQLQLIWHLLPYLRRANEKDLPELKIYGGVNSLVYVGQKTLYASTYGLPEDAPTRIRDAKFRYIVGNPPYIRNERLKDSGPWRKNYDQVDFRNSDIAYFFVARAIEGKPKVMPCWLEKGGRMCFVLPMGVCDSKAASVIRDTLLKYTIVEVTDLEGIAIHIFPSPQASGRATTAPVLLFVEKSESSENLVDLVQVTEEAASNEKIEKPHILTGQIEQQIFLKNPINPYGQILPKLRTNDILPLQKLMDHPKIVEFMVKPTPTYGISIGRKEGLHRSPEDGLFPLGKGLNVSTFRIDPNVSSWVDLEKVRSKSIWGKELVKNAFALSTICLAPQCAMFNPLEIALNASTIIMVPKPEYSDFPWDVVLNSSPIRFIHLLTLRTALVGVGTPIGNNRRVSWCTIYPRTISALPIPKNLLDDRSRLRRFQNGLCQSAEKIATRWDTIEKVLKETSQKPLALHGVDFTHWQLDINRPADFRLERAKEEWVLRVYDKAQSSFLKISGSYELLNVVKFLLDNQIGKASLTAREFQNLIVTEDLERVSRLIDEARDPNSSDIRAFRKLFSKSDKLISMAYGLDARQWEYIRDRLANPPFDVQEPRWPWKTVAKRDIKRYSVDRFA